ncbi:MAG: helix-turn-helix domain containing protein [Azoarcus sp.]|jgi:hypothetical protein|nr:helix-turn-helix domain containing protein [Azoarcus sp.]
MRTSKDFVLRLERLKVSLGVSDDQAVAGALGMSLSALSGRKTRGVWPESEVRLLAHKHPELNIDVEWVSSGESPEAWKAMFTTSQQVAEKSTTAPGKSAAVAESVVSVGELSDDEQCLVARFRRCNEESRAMLLQYCELLTKE